MKDRRVLQILKKFALAELREKKCDEVIICRPPQTLVMRRGRTPETRVREIKGAGYLVCARKGRSKRVYFFSPSGEMLGAEDVFGENQEFLSSCTTLFRFM